jgi:transposase InsO family protein
MSKKELKRINILCRIERGEETMVRASSMLGISERQMYRVVKRYREAGDGGLCHALRGRASNQAFAPEVCVRAMRLLREQYSDYGPTLFAEKLEAHHQIFVSRHTVTRWMKKEHLYIPQRLRRRHRRKRERRGAIGEMIQLDGSIHDWLEGRGPVCCLIVMIDDASSHLYLHFADSESTESVLTCMRGYIERYGLPGEIYTDHGSVYYDNAKPECVTQYGRVLKSLGIRPIYANSPQAKGRVERTNRTLQDRLLKELREHNVSTIADANQFVQEHFCDRHNQRFSQPEGLPDVHRTSAGIDLDGIFCYQTSRCVNYDYTVSLNATFLQIEKSAAPMPPPRARVIVQQWFNGSTHLLWNDHELSFSFCKDRPKQRKSRKPPAANHPWRNRTFKYA